MNRKCNLGIDPYIKSLCLKNLGTNPPVNKFEYRDQSSQVFLDMGHRVSEYLSKKKGTEVWSMAN